MLTSSTTGLTMKKTGYPRAFYLMAWKFPYTVSRATKDKSSAKRVNSKTPAFRFRVDGKHFRNGAFRKRWRHDNREIFLTKFPSNTNPNWPVINAFSNSSGLIFKKFFGIKIRDGMLLFLIMSLNSNLSTVNNNLNNTEGDQWVLYT